jgi:hypothetical protein
LNRHYPDFVLLRSSFFVRVSWASETAPVAARRRLRSSPAAGPSSRRCADS